MIDIVLDLSGRPFVYWEVPIPECIPLGNPPFDPNLAEHAISSFATAANITLHVTLVRGSNVHHIVEAVFKAGGVLTGRELAEVILAGRTGPQIAADIAALPQRVVGLEA